MENTSVLAGRCCCPTTEADPKSWKGPALHEQDLRYQGMLHCHLYHLMPLLFENSWIFLCYQFSECELELQYCVKDGLLKEYKALGFKGARVGLEQEGYKLPSIEEEWVGDWSCAALESCLPWILIVSLCMSGSRWPWLVLLWLPSARRSCVLWWLLEGVPSHLHWGRLDRREVHMCGL